MTKASVESRGPSDLEAFFINDGLEGTSAAQDGKPGDVNGPFSQIGGTGEIGRQSLPDKVGMEPLRWRRSSILIQSHMGCAP